MIESVPIRTPGGFAPAFVLGQAGPDGQLLLVSADNPLPVSGAAAGAALPPLPSPLTGTATGAAMAGPFKPAAGRPVYLQLAGTWQGRVRVLRSVDGGVTKVPLTVAGHPWAIFTAPACEAVWEESEDAAHLYLELQPASGAIAYRVSQ